MKVIIDKETCTGCGLCVETCPEVFEMDKNDIAEVKIDTVPASAEATCKEAVKNCPSEAIKVE